MENVTEKPSQAAEPESEKPLAEFGELVHMMAELPQEQIEKVTIFTHGLVAGSKLNRR